MSEKPLPRHPFDWWGFWVRFACGAILGCMIGCRSWAKHWDAADPPWGLLASVITGGIFVGLLGAFYKEDFWRRP